MERSRRIGTILSMLEKEPNDIFLNYSLGLEHVGNGNFDLAEEQFKRVIAIQTDYIPAFFHLGKLYEQIQQTKEALKYYKFGLECAKKQKNNKAVNEISEAIFILED
ncbi:MAG: tetratricopeptide repeat protein [Bacteroidota bacterium]|nr:tetratricopeptide repeat protein [Bacteroidota bacterium]